MKKYIVLILSIPILTSCSYFLLKKMKVTNPKLETVSSIKEYLIKKNIQERKLFFFKDLNSMTTFSNEYKLDIPEAYFFNKEGLLVPYKKTSQECNAHVSDFINDLSNFKTFPIDSSFSLKKINKLIVDEKNKSTLLDKTNGNITIILSFAKYLGKINDEHTFNWINLIKKVKKEKNINVDIILLNGDFMTFWNIKEEELPKIY